MRLIAMFMLLAFTVSLHAQDDALAFVKKIIDARGGADNLNKLRVCKETTKGKIFADGDDIPFTGEALTHYPSLFRLSIKVKIKGVEYAQTRGLSGTGGWLVDLKGEKRDLTGKDLDELREDLFHDDLMRLVPLLRNDALKLTLLDEVKVEGKLARGLKISAAGKRDLHLWFDKESNLLVKMARQGYDADAKKLVAQEQYYGDYQTVQGVRYPMRWLSYQEGQKSMEGEITEVSFPASLPADLFAPPQKK